MRKNLLIALLLCLGLLAGCGATETPETETAEPKVDSVESDSFYAKWQQEKEDSDGRDKYVNLITGKEEMMQEMSCGWIDDGTRAYLGLLSGKDLMDASYNEVLDVYNALGRQIGNSGYSVYDFFTTDATGNATADGFYNFLDTVAAVTEQKASWITDEGGYAFDFDAVGGDGAVAGMIGVSEELVKILLHAGSDAGFDIDFTD